MGSRAMLKSCHAGVDSTPSNASVLSIRITNITRSQPAGPGLSSPTPHDRRYTATMRPASSRSASTGPNRPTMSNSTVNASQCPSHSSRPNSTMPARVRNVYASTATATNHGWFDMPEVSSRQAKARYRNTAGHTPTFGSLSAGRIRTRRLTAS